RVDAGQLAAQGAGEGARFNVRRAQVAHAAFVAQQQEGAAVALSQGDDLGARDAGRAQRAQHARLADRLRRPAVAGPNAAEAVAPRHAMFFFEDERFAVESDAQDVTARVAAEDDAGKAEEVARRR